MCFSLSHFYDGTKVPVGQDIFGLSNLDCAPPDCYALIDDALFRTNRPETLDPLIKDLHLTQLHFRLISIQRKVLGSDRWCPELDPELDPELSTCLARVP